MTKAAKKEDFMSTLDKLEELVGQLESGEKGLEESMALFEKGLALAKSLTTQLQEAKHKVEVLTHEGGKLSRKEFEEA